jgi:hypothetical protein
VRLISQETNGLFSTYDRELAGAVGKRWRELLAERSAAGPRVLVTLEFQLHSDGRVTDLRTVQNTGTEVFGLVAQKAVVDLAPYASWPTAPRRALTNECRILRLNFSFQERAEVTVLSRTMLTADQAGLLAQQLANEKAQELYSCQPFRDGPPARLVQGHWEWHRLQAVGQTDMKATVEFAVGREPKVTVILLDSRARLP